jgi:hypothetical protein
MAAGKKLPLKFLIQFSRITSFDHAALAPHKTFSPR